eukprot:TRINITY_DN32717_c0_g1_i1.p1 TRINITY_DN32717_c0_g1~~TRINITY_DN32717_c0_g1_i1.p1  ORF type:complete len:134 (+),score=37.21 TRINITY_DN32717_c0_g1_i1:42-443(+)
MSGTDAADDAEMAAAPKGLLPKHVFDMALSGDGVKLARGGRMGAYRAAHAFILAAASMAQPAGGGEVTPQDLVAALEAMGVAEIAAEVGRVVERDEQALALQREAEARAKKAKGKDGKGGPGRGRGAAQPKRK